MTIASTVRKFATLDNAKAFKADSYQEATMFVCDLTGWSVNDQGFNSMQDKLEDAWEALLATEASIMTTIIEIKTLKAAWCALNTATKTLTPEIDQTLMALLEMVRVREAQLTEQVADK